MENKGKKIWTILLTVYLTIVTVGCVFFGYMYFADKGGNKLENLSVSEAEVLVSDVKNKTAATFSTVSGASLDEDDYAAEEFPSIITGSGTSNLLNGIDNVLKDCVAILQKDASAGIWYKYSAVSEEYIKYNIVENKVYIYLAATPTTLRPLFSQTYIITKTGEKTWTVETYLSFNTSVTQHSNYYPQMMTYKCDGTKIYYIETAITPLQTDKIVTSVKNASEIVACGYYQCDLNSHKETDRFTTQEKMALLTDAEKVEIANRVLLYVSANCGQYKAADFEGAQQI